MLSATGWVFVLYGIAIILIDAYGVYKPRVWVELVERQLMYRRVRVTSGVIFVSLALLPIYFFLGGSSWQLYVLSVLSGLFLILGVLLLAFPLLVRNSVLSLGALDDKVLRYVLLGDLLFGLLLVFVGLLV